MGTGEFNAGGNPAMDWHLIQGGVKILLVTSCGDKRRPDGPSRLVANFTFKGKILKKAFDQSTKSELEKWLLYSISCLYPKLKVGVFIEKNITYSIFIDTKAEITAM